MHDVTLHSVPQWLTRVSPKYEVLGWFDGPLGGCWVWGHIETHSCGATALAQKALTCQ